MPINTVIRNEVTRSDSVCVVYKRAVFDAVGGRNAIATETDIRVENLGLAEFPCIFGLIPVTGPCQ
jgi:hypothetical protein